MSGSMTYLQDTGSVQVGQRSADPLPPSPNRDKISHPIVCESQFVIQQPEKEPVERGQDFFDQVSISEGWGGK